MSKKTLSRVGAGALALATVVTGLSFGPAAFAETAVTADAKSDQIHGPLVFQRKNADASDKWSTIVNTTTTTSGWPIRTYATYEEAAAASVDWVFPKVGATGQVQPTTNPKNYCLAIGAASNYIVLRTCSATDAQQKMQWKDFSRDGMSGKTLFTAAAASPSIVFADSNYSLYASTTTGGGGNLIDMRDLKSYFGGSVLESSAAARTATIGGDATANAAVIYSYTDRSGKRVTDQVYANDEGKWSADLKNLKIGPNANSVSLEQWLDGVKTSTYDLTVKVAVAPLSATGAIENGRDNLAKKATVSGKAEPGSIVQISEGDKVIASSNSVPESGDYSVEIPAPNKAGVRVLHASQMVSDELFGDEEVGLDYGRALSVDMPVDGQSHNTTSPVSMSGKGQADSLITVRETSKPNTVIGSGYVRADSSWSFDTDVLEGGKKHVLEITQQSKGGNVLKETRTLNPDAESTKDVTLTSPVSGSEFDANTAVTFRGEGEPDATITVDPGAGLAPVTTKVGDNGEWSVPKFLGNGKYTFTIKQVAGNKTSFVNNVVLTPKATTPIDKPFAVTSPEAGSDHKGKMVTFTGTGKAGETVTLHVTNFASADVTTKVGNDGNWSVPKFLGTGAYAFDITQSGTTDAVRDFRLNQPAAGADKPFAVTTAPTGEVTAGLYTFSGTGTVGATVKLEPTGGQSAATAEVQGDGTWSVSKWIGTSKYDFKVSMTKGDVTENLANIVVTGK